MSYQAIYDAVRSRIHGADIGEVLREFLYREGDFNRIVEIIKDSAEDITIEKSRPCVLFHPKVYIDGNKWCALYGENLQDGVAGFGGSPSEAMADFDMEWKLKLGDTP